MVKKTLPAVKPTVSSAIIESPKDEARERKWKVEDALRDIERAETHKKDRSLMSDVKKLAKEKMKALGKIC